MTKNQQPAPDAENDQQADAAGDVWLLEDVYPIAETLLQSSRVVSAGDESVIIVLDTNALMVPLSLSKEKLPQIEDAYQRLLNSNRLFVPARAIREFVKNRDTKLADLAKALSDRASKVTIDEVKIPPLLEGLKQTLKVSESATDLANARKKYLQAVQTLVDEIKSWRGDDPVTTTYHRLFPKEVLIDTDSERATVETEWAERLRRKIPPGYKDGGKPDTGIGDYLIWLAILKLGEVKKCDLIFVTGEEKADWFVRAGGERVYPRLELIDEYRRAANGKNIHLATLAEILAQMKVSNDVVQDVRNAELVANTAIQIASTSHRRLADGFIIFDYSTHDGQIGIGDGPASVLLKFSGASKSAIYVLRSAGAPSIARARNIAQGHEISFDELDSTSSHYRVGIGEVFLAKNDAGYIAAVRIHDISSETHGDSSDEITFTYSIFRPGQKIVAP